MSTFVIGVPGIHRRMSTEDKGLLESLLPKFNDALPTEFYGRQLKFYCVLLTKYNNLYKYFLSDVRQETTPKAAWFPMYILAIITYIVAIVIFVSLFVEESKIYATETTIQSHDLTGSNGYTCQMISKVTNSYDESLPLHTDMAQVYNLINIMQSKSQCVANLKTADPCAYQQSFFPGTSREVQPDQRYTVAVAIFDDEVAFYLTKNGIMRVYDYKSGQVFPGDCDVPILDTIGANQFAQTISMGVDNKLNTYFSSGFDGINSSISQFNFTSLSCAIFYSFVGNLDLSVFNDNFYNVFVLANHTTVYILDVYSLPATTTLLFQDDDGIEAIAAHFEFEDFEPTYYYIQSRTGQIVMRKDGVVSVLVPHMQDDDESGTVFGPLVTDGSYLYILLGDAEYGFTTVGRYSTIVPGGDYSPLNIPLGVQLQGLAISDNGMRLATTTISVVFGMWVSDTVVFYYLDGEYDSLETVEQQIDFGAGWFTCEDSVISVPSVAAQFTSVCKANGLVGKIMFHGTDRAYFFTPTDAANFAIQESQGQCRSLYDSICNTVADLPPYSCSRKIYPTTLQVLGTTLANTQFAVSFVIFLFGIALSRMARWFPPAVLVDSHHSDSPDAAAAAATTSAGEKEDLHGCVDIEMSTIYSTRRDHHQEENLNAPVRNPLADQ